MKVKSMNKGVIRLSLFGLLALTLAGCEGMKDQLGLNPTAPDEFAVVTKAPLVLPPDFSLRPPQPGAARPQELSARGSARAALMGRAGAPASGASLSRGEVALLSLAEADKADPLIRTVVNRETTQLVVDSKSFTDRLLFWQKPGVFGTVVDPAKEAQRLRENAAMGKPVTEGDTPSIKRRKKAPLEGLFN